jgi:type II secretory pathway component GspD/PulD (secretin)
MKKLVLVSMLSLTACAMPPEKSVETTQIDNVPRTQQLAPRTSNYVSITTSKKQILDERVTINQPRVALIDALTHPTALTNANIVALDSGVNLALKVGVRAQNSRISDYIRQIEGSTDYKIDVIQNSEGVLLQIASTMTKSWDMAALSDMPEATTRSGFSATAQQSSNGGGAMGGNTSSGASGSAQGQTQSASGTNIVTTREDETWTSLIEDAQRILGLIEDGESSANSGNSNDQNSLIPQLKEGDDPISFLNDYSRAIDDEMNPFIDTPWVVGNKRLGKITAYGKPSQIRRLDEHFSKLETESQRQVHLSGAILDIKTTRGEGYGVDWNAIYQNSAGDKTVTFAGETTQALSIVDGGNWSVAASIPFGNLTLNAIVESLREQGSVTLQSQPRLTVTNGYTAYLGSTQEFSFVSGVEFLPLTSGGDGNVASDTAITTTLSRVNVGIKIAVTPKMLDDGKILVDIVPILSSITGFTPISSGGEVFETPNIALQELATQVITTSGTPIYLGGLIINRVLQNTQRLPIKNELLAKALGGARFEQENSELLIVITPQEVGA